MTQKRRWLCGLVAAGLSLGGAARAADHYDAPGVLADPSTDITDVYGWMTPDAGRMILVANVFPNADANAKFSTTALYVFHFSAQKSYGDAAPVTSTIVCAFDAAQVATCWGPGGEYLHGDASAPQGLASESAKMRLFAGLRDDPSFFNLEGWKDAVTGTKAALVNDPAACPKAQTAALDALRTKCGQNGMGGAPRDSYRKGGSAGGASYSGNVLSLVMTVEKTLVVDADHKIVAYWVSTNKAK